MTLKIDKKIVGYEVRKAENPNQPVPESVPKQVGLTEALPQSSVPGEMPEDTSTTAEDAVKIVQMHERVVRPDVLVGSTYKIKTPVSEHAFYITINDMLLNQGTPYEKRRPFEIFINSKNMDHYQWITGLTLIISAVFRKGGDVTFLVEELKSVFDPKGGYFKRGGKFMPSLVAEIGEAIESHLKTIGMIVETGLDKHQQALVDSKRKEYEARAAMTAGPCEVESAFPATAVVCGKCSVKSVIMMDGCMTCLNCGDSKCG